MAPFDLKLRQGEDGDHLGIVKIEGITNSAQYVVIGHSFKLWLTDASALKID
jgi:hypothetical protein